jgi:beta-phosphoglucomutase
MADLASGLALIFDMDGVIIHSNPVHRQAWEIFNQRYGLATTEDMHRRMYGRRNDQIVRDFYGEALPDDEVAARGAAKEQVYRRLLEGCVENALVPGVRQFLERYRGFPIGLATNAEPANVEFLLDSAGLRPHFTAIVDGHQVERPKPDPEVYLKAAACLGIDPTNCIVFEDSESGVQAARTAQMRVVGMLTTHDYLPDTCFQSDNFLNENLASWLRVQLPAL